MLEWLENTQFSSWVRSDLLGWPLALTIHVLGTAVAAGFIAIIGLRLLGLFPLIPYAALKRFFPIVWVALVVQLASGITLWMARPTRYVADGGFVVKFTLVVIGVGLTFYVYLLIGRESAAWDAKTAASARTVPLAAATLLVWSGVVIASRLTGYLGSL